MKRKIKLVIGLFIVVLCLFACVSAETTASVNAEIVSPNEVYVSVQTNENSGVVVLALYDENGALEECTTEDLVNGCFNGIIENEKEYSFGKVMVWSSLSEMRSLADGKTIKYSDYMGNGQGKYVKIRGVVTENKISALGSIKLIDTTSENNVRIFVEDNFGADDAFIKYVNDTGTGLAYFLAGKTNADDYIGYRVIAYVKNVDGKFELISIAKDLNSNETLTIALDQYDSYVAKTGDCDTIKYYENGANYTTDIAVEKNFDAIVNGIGMSGSSAINYIANNSLKGGEITFIDNDDIKGYDVAIVTIATTGVVKKVTEDGILFYNNVALPDGTTKVIEIDLNNETKVFELTKDGKAIDFTTLEEWDVLSIYAVSETADVIKAEVVTTKVVGTLKYVKQSHTSAINQTAFNVNDVWYDVAQGCYGLTDISVGDNGTFYIDRFGKIVAFDEALDIFAYVIDTPVKPTDLGGDSLVDVKAQVLTTDGVKTLDFQNKVEINIPGSAIVTVDETDGWTISGTVAIEEDGTTMTDAINGLLGIVVMLRKNSAGEISKITMANADDKFAKVTSTTVGTFDAENMRFITSYGTIYADTDAMVFIVDTDSTKCRMGTMADFDDGNSYHIIATYATRKATDNDIFVVQANSFLSTSTTSNIAVITEFAYGANEDGEETLSLGFMLNGEEVFADTVAKSDLTMVTSGYAASDVSVGDIVKVKIGSEGLITAIAGIYDFTNNTVRDYSSLSASAATGTKVGSDSSSEKFDGGVVTAYNENNALATIGGNQYKLSQAANTYVVDGTGRNLVIENGSENNFKYYEMLYAGTTNVTVTDKNNTSDTITTTGAEAQAYADHVYVRTYENKVTDVVIVKGLDIKVQ